MNFHIKIKLNEKNRGYCPSTTIFTAASLYLVSSDKRLTANSCQTDSYKLPLTAMAALYHKLLDAEGRQ